MGERGFNFTGEKVPKDTVYNDFMAVLFDFEQFWINLL